MKQLKDYIHLYLGCDFQADNSSGSINSYTIYHINAYWEMYQNFKLLLRPLSSMTEDEKDGLRHADRLATSQNILPEIRASRLTNYHFTQKSAEITRYLLSRGFDLYDLIPAGLAIDKTLQPSKQ